MGNLVFLHSYYMTVIHHQKEVLLVAAMLRLLSFAQIRQA